MKARVRAWAVAALLCGARGLFRLSYIIGRVQYAPMRSEIEAVSESVWMVGAWCVERARYLFGEGERE